MEKRVKIIAKSTLKMLEEEVNLFLEINLGRLHDVKIWIDEDYFTDRYNSILIYTPEKNEP